MGGKTSERQRVEALAAYVATNNKEKAAAIAGVDPKSVTAWIAERPEDVERIRVEMQKAYVGDLKALGDKLLFQALNASVDIANAKDMQAILISFGIVVDKMAKLLGIADKVEHYGTITHNVNDLQARQGALDDRRRLLRQEFGEIVDVEYRPVEEQDGHSVN